MLRTIGQSIKKQVIATIGYGPQGKGQSLNLRDNGFNVILGLRENGKSWKNAQNDGWIPGKNLFNIDEASKKASVIQYLLSDAAQISQWGVISKNLNLGDTLYFSHGLGIVYPKLTGIIPPKDVDVIMVAPKGPGGMVRKAYLEGSGINSSYAIHQDFSQHALSNVKELAKGIGSLNIFPTTFQNEVYSDLTGERCVLMGMIQGAFKAQYDVLRENGHDSEEAFNETVEEALVSLYPLINENGMDWMFKNCSSTAQHGALKWCGRFEEVLKPVIKECYDSVKSGKEVKEVLESNSRENYKEELDGKLKELEDSEIWQVGKKVREMRGENKEMIKNKKVRWHMDSYMYSGWPPQSK